jgi:hypothetical protein
MIQDSKDHPIRQKTRGFQARTFLSTRENPLPCANGIGLEPKPEAQSHVISGHIALILRQSCTILSLFIQDTYKNMLQVFELKLTSY